MPFRRTSRPDPAATLAARPVRLADVPLVPTPDGGGRLHVPLRPPTRLHWLYRVPPGATKAFELDSVGRFVWESIDGVATVEDIVRRLAARFGLDLRQAQLPTLTFLRTLARKGLIGVTPQDTAGDAP